MADDLVPYSQTRSGAVTDLEHARLWSTQDDGILAGETGNPLDVQLSGGNWTVQPGRLLIAGKVLTINDVASGGIPGPAPSTRRCVVVFYVDHSTSPWTYGIKLVQGTPGAGRPTWTNSLLGEWRVPLRAFDVPPSGAAVLLEDERPFLVRTGRALGAIATPGQLPNPLDVRRLDGTVIVRASPFGRVGFGRNPGSATGVIITALEDDDIPLVVQQPPVGTNHLQRWTDAGAAIKAWVEANGDIHAPNIDGDIAWQTYTPSWAGAGSGGFSTRTGRWRRIGPRTVAFNIYVVMSSNGTGGAEISTSLPTAPSRATRQTFAGHCNGPSAALHAVTATGGTGNTIDAILVVTDGSTRNLVGTDCLNNRIFTISGVYEEA